MENHNWDRLIWKIPYLFAYLIIIVEQELIGKMVIVYVIFFIWLIEMIAKQNRVKKERSLDRKSLGIATFILILLLSLIWINEVYFIVGLLSLLFLFYKVFEFIGDLVEKILMKKVEFPVLLISLIKLGIWTVGYYLFIHCFAYFLENYINIIGKSDDLIVKAIKIDEGIILSILYICLSLLMSLFIIDFLMKMAFNGLKPFTFQMLTRIEGFKVFFCLAVVIIFADLTFGLIYLSFSGLSVNETLIIEENIFNFLKVISSFYYAFCLHFAIPLPTTPFFLQIDESVKTSSSLQIIQFFHFCINKLIDLTILAYMAGSFVSAFGQRQEKKEKLEIND